MNRKNKTLLLIIAALVISNGLLLYLYLAKKDDRHGPRDRRGMMTEMLKNDVGFDTGQLAKFEQLKSAHMEQTRKLFDSMRTAREALFSQMNRYAAGDSALLPHLNSIARLQQRLDLQVYGNIAEVRKLCTAAQLPKFDSVAVKIMARIGGGKRPGNPDDKKK